MAKKVLIKRSYPASVITAGLQAVWDLCLAGTGIRTPTTKTFGVDSLPANCMETGGYLLITGNATLSNWDFAVAANTGGVVVRGDSTIVTFNDCKFGPRANNPAVTDTQHYGLQVPDDATTHPTVNLNYCTFDGGKYQSNVGVPGPWSGAALYVLMGATVTADHCKFTDIGYDVIKVTNATYTQTWCLIQAYGWNQNSDADAVQMISGAVDVEHCMYDISDGGFPVLGTAFPGTAPNEALFCTIDTPSTGDGTPTVKNNIFFGWSHYTAQAGWPNNTPHTVVSVADNHTATGNGFHIRDGVWQNNVIQPGNAGASGYFTHGGTETSAVSIASWTGNIDYATGATITAPSF